MNIYLEVSNKRAFAGALDWPGWCRSGRNGEAATQALAAYQPRYARVLQAAGIPFHVVADAPGFTVVEQLTGNATTDFGAPGIIPNSDTRSLEDGELAHLHAILEACWAAFDKAAKAADGRELQKGPRGGGRSLEKIVDHVLGAEISYLGMLPRKHKLDEHEDLAATFKRERNAVLDAIAAAGRGELAQRMPRGGVPWPPRYFVRRAAWHVLDHAWEIEDRIV